MTLQEKFTQFRTAALGSLKQPASPQVMLRMLEMAWCSGAYSVADGVSDPDVRAAATALCYGFEDMLDSDEQGRN